MTDADEAIMDSLMEFFVKHRVPPETALAAASFWLGSVAEKDDADPSATLARAHRVVDEFFAGGRGKEEEER